MEKPTPFFDQLKEYLAKGRNKLVIEELTLFIKTETPIFRNDIVSFSAQKLEIDKMVLSQTHSLSESNQLMNRWRQGILNLIDEVSETFSRSSGVDVYVPLVPQSDNQSDRVDSNNIDTSFNIAEFQSELTQRIEGLSSNTQRLAKKIALIGAHGVGKTSIISQFVFQRFPESYLTTIGLKVDKKTIEIEGNSIDLVIWDVAGQDNPSNIPHYYLNGCSGFIIVSDVTRPNTFRRVLPDFEIFLRQLNSYAEVVYAFNKVDLLSEKERESLEQLIAKEYTKKGKIGILTSAKTNENIETGFTLLARLLLTNHF